MAVVDRTGVVSRSLSEYVTLLNERMRAALGADLALDPETPAGQIVGIVALSLAEADEAIVQIGNALGVDTAQGVHLDDLGSLLLVDRLAATYSTATVQATGVVGTTVPVGSRVSNADGSVVFAATEEVVLAAGANVIPFRALEVGEVAAPAGTLSRIVTPVPGWETATNATAAVPGRPAQTDAAYRANYRDRTAYRTAGAMSGLQAALIEAGADKVQIQENASAAGVTRQGFYLPAHSVIAVCEGGTDTDLAAAMLRHVGMGVGIQTARYGGAHSTLAQIIAVTTGLRVAETDLAAPDFTGVTTLAGAGAAVAATLRAAADGRTAAANVAYPPAAASGGAFRWAYPWRESGELAPETNALATALGLAPAGIGDAQGPVLRPRERALAVTVTATIDRLRFPADGLASMRQAVRDVVASYRIGQQARRNDFLVGVEAVRGTNVTALAVTDNGTDAETVSMPLDGLYTLADSAISITLS